MALGGGVWSSGVGRIEIAQREIEHRMHRHRESGPIQYRQCQPRKHRRGLRYRRQLSGQDDFRFSESEKVQRFSQAARAARHRRRRRRHARPHPRPGHGRAHCDLGKHVYCEKPLTHTVSEARTIAELAAKAKVATQMGTQIHASDNYRRVVEIDPIRRDRAGEAKSTPGRAALGAAATRPTDTPPVPPNIHWDLWIGPAPDAALQSDLSSGQLARLVGFRRRQHRRHGLPPHGPAVLGARPAPSDHVEAEGPPVNPETCPLGLIVRYEYRRDGDRPRGQANLVRRRQNPADRSTAMPTGGGGNLFVGEKGMLWADYDRYHFYPEKDFAGYKPPPPIDSRVRSAIMPNGCWPARRAARRPATSATPAPSDRSRAAGQRGLSHRQARWDAEKLQATNCPEAERFLRNKYREGWSL